MGSVTVRTYSMPCLGEGGRRLESVDVK
jgi:hypothetical protein